MKLAHNSQGRPRSQTKPLPIPATTKSTNRPFFLLFLRLSLSLSLQPSINTVLQISTLSFDRFEIFERFVGFLWKASLPNLHILLLASTWSFEHNHLLNEMGVSFKVAKTGTRFRPKAPQAEISVDDAVENSKESSRVFSGNESSAAKRKVDVITLFFPDNC